MSKTINQRYRLELISLLPSIGEIFRAYDVRLYRPVTVWLLPKSRNSLVAAFLKEYDKFLNLNIYYRPELYDKGIDKVSGQPYLVFEQVDICKTLHDLLEYPKTFSSRETITISIDLLKTIDLLHNLDIAHNRLNPKNILYCQGTVRIIGIGLKYIQGVNTISPNDLAFLSPEQLSETTTSKISDLYAVGVLMYRMLTGQPLFTELDVTSLRQAQVEKLSTSSYLNSALSKRPEFAGIISKLLAFEPSNRYQNVSDVIVVLESMKANVGDSNE